MKSTYVTIISNLVSADNFTTNNYYQNNNYVDLNSNKQAPSELWSEDYLQQQQQQNQNWSQKMKPDITMKQMGNKIKMTAENTQNKFNGYDDSLI